MTEGLRRRNPICARNGCVCRCHWEGKGHRHCHEGRTCCTVTCTCGQPLPPAPPLRDLFPKVRVARGGIKYPTPKELEDHAAAIRHYWTEGLGARKFTPTLIAADVPVPGYRHDDLVRKIADTLNLPAEMLDPSIRKRTTTERKPMYSVRVVIEEEGRPLIDIDITTTRPREGINAAAKAADDAMKAHPDGPTEPEPASDGVFSDERPDRAFQPTPERARF